MVIIGNKSVMRHRGNDRTSFRAFFSRNENFFSQSKYLVVEADCEFNHEDVAKPLAFVLPKKSLISCAASSGSICRCQCSIRAAAKPFQAKSPLWCGRQIFGQLTRGQYLAAVAKNVFNKNGRNFLIKHHFNFSSFLGNQFFTCLPFVFVLSFSAGIIMPTMVTVAGMSVNC